MPGTIQNPGCIDPQTGEVIPTETIMKNLKRLDELIARLEVGSNVYHQWMRKAKGSHEEKQRIAKKKGNEAQGGRRTDLWDEAHDDQVVMSMCVTGPPAYDADEARKNENKLRCAIYCLDKWLHREMVDVWTSVKEIGTFHETYIYCRWPYHLATQVDRLAVSLATFDAGGSHKFQAEMTYDGRKNLSVWRAATIEPWQLTCNGKVMPAMSQEDIKAATSRGSTETATDRFLAGMAYNGNMAIKDGNGEDDALKECLYEFEIDYLKGTQAYWCSEMLLTKVNTKIAQVYFWLTGKFIWAVDHGINSPSNGLTLYTAKKSVDYQGHKLFLSIKVGDTFLALDAPFAARMEANENLHWDDPCGIKLLYVLQYALDRQQGMQIVGAGAVFQQLLDASNHTFSLYSLGAIMAPKMASFGALVSHQQGPLGPSAPSPAASSASMPQVFDNDVFGP